MGHLVVMYIFYFGMNNGDTRGFGPYDTLKECNMHLEAVQSELLSREGTTMEDPNLKVSKCKEIKQVVEDVRKEA